MMMYPGDTWDYGGPYSSEPALERYEKDQATIPTRERVQPKVVPAEELIASAKRFRELLTDGSSRLRMRIHLARDCHRRKRQQGQSTGFGALLRLKVEPARIYVTDHARSYRFDLFHGLRPAELEQKDCEVMIGSEGLHYAFSHLWGGEALFINGRFTEVHPGGRHALFHYFFLAGNRNAGRVMNWRQIAGKIVRLAGRKHTSASAG
jgi:hypothetical protein